MGAPLTSGLHELQPRRTEHVGRKQYLSLSLTIMLDDVGSLLFECTHGNLAGDVQNSGTLGGAVTAMIGIAAVVVAVVALSNSQRHEALLAIGISAVVVFILAAIVFFVRTRSGNRRPDAISGMNNASSRK